MRNTFLSSLLVAVFLLVSGFPAQAAGTATMTLDAASYEVVRGQFLDVTVSVDPHEEALDTARAVVTFDPRILNATSVQLSGALDRVAPGNYFDSETGMISWGAFTLNSPVTTPTSFMTVTFMAVATGEGNIAISADSRAIADGEERINVSALGKATVMVKEATESVPGVALLAVESPTHPNQNTWYSNTSVELSWTELDGDTPVAQYLYSWGLDTQTQPFVRLDGATKEVSLEAKADGLYYFQLKGVQKDGRETPTATRFVRVDTTVPNPIDLSVQDDKILVGESAWFLFATTDETSGVVDYQVAINDSEFQTQVSPLEIEDLSAGTYFFRVAALDRAGNVTYGGVSVRVYPEGTDMSRPDGYEQSAEVQTIAASLDQTVTEVSGNKTMLITLVLGIGALLAIIYASRKRRN